MGNDILHSSQNSGCTAVQPASACKPTSENVSESKQNQIGMKPNKATRVIQSADNDERLATAGRKVFCVSDGEIITDTVSSLIDEAVLLSGSVYNTRNDEFKQVYPPCAPVLIEPHHYRTPPLQNSKATDTNISNVFKTSSATATSYFGHEDQTYALRINVNCNEELSRQYVCSSEKEKLQNMQQSCKNSLQHAEDLDQGDSQLIKLVNAKNKSKDTFGDELAMMGVNFSGRHIASLDDKTLQTFMPCETLYSVRQLLDILLCKVENELEYDVSQITETGIHFNNVKEANVNIRTETSVCFSNVSTNKEKYIFDPSEMAGCITKDAMLSAKNFVEVRHIAITVDTLVDFILNSVVSSVQNISHPNDMVTATIAEANFRTSKFNDTRLNVNKEQFYTTTVCQYADKLILELLGQALIEKAALQDNGAFGNDSAGSSSDVTCRNSAVDVKFDVTGQLSNDLKFNCSFYDMLNEEGNTSYGTCNLNATRSLICPPETSSIGGNYSAHNHSTFPPLSKNDYNGPTCTTIGNDTAAQEFKNAYFELEEKYRHAMVQVAQLDNERSQLQYQTQQLRDILDEQEDDFYRLTNEHKRKCQEVEKQKHALVSLQNKCSDLQEVLRQRDELIEDFESKQKDDENLDRDVFDLKETVMWKDKKIKALVSQIEFYKKQEIVKSHEQGLVVVGEDNVNDIDGLALVTNNYKGGLALVTPETAQLLESAGDGPLDSRLKHLAEEKQDLLDQVRRLNFDLDEERSKSSTNGTSGILCHDNDFTEMQLLEIQREANKQVNEYKLKLQKSEQDIATYHANIARLEGQLQRFKYTSEIYEKNEDDMRAEKRKLMRDLRTALDRIEEMEMTNSHLEKRLERLRASRITAAQT